MRARPPDTISLNTHAIVSPSERGPRSELARFASVAMGDWPMGNEERVCQAVISNVLAGACWVPATQMFAAVC